MANTRPTAPELVVFFYFVAIVIWRGGGGAMWL